MYFRNERYISEIIIRISENEDVFRRVETEFQKSVNVFQILKNDFKKCEIDFQKIVSTYCSG